MDALIEAIDHLKILDPTCGSGAFPMGFLHKLVFVLGKLDPGNQRRKARQLAKAAEIPDATVRERVLADIEQTFGANELDYGRKLYLIEKLVREAGRVFPQVKITHVKKLPLAIPLKREQDESATKVKAILQTKWKDVNADTTILEHEIDHFVYTLYGLTPEEIRLIDEFALSSGPRT